MDDGEYTTPPWRSRVVPDLLLVLILSAVTYLFAHHFDIFERIASLTLQHEDWELDEAISVSLVLVFALGLFSLRRLREVSQTLRRLRRANADLREALQEVNTLRGIIPICASCKKIRDDQGYWHQVESYIRLHSEAEFSHCVCPDCAKELYPEEQGELGLFDTGDLPTQ